jgi:hypothetical protein
MGISETLQNPNLAQMTLCMFAKKRILTSLVGSSGFRPGRFPSGFEPGDNLSTTIFFEKKKYKS